jgi:hypothetical protein
LLSHAPPGKLTRLTVSEVCDGRRRCRESVIERRASAEIELLDHREGLKQVWERLLMEHPKVGLFGEMMVAARSPQTDGEIISGADHYVHQETSSACTHVRTIAIFCCTHVQQPVSKMAVAILSSN